MPTEIKGPGLLYVNSKLASDLIDETTYQKWYREDHIPEVIATSGIDSAMRCRDVDPAADKPNLVLYPMKDIGFTQTEEFKKIKVHSDILPDGKPIYDLAELDVRYYGLSQVFDEKKVGPGQTKLILTAGIELSPAITFADFDSWYRDEHLGELNKCPGYLRTTRYQLLFSRSNAESRVLKGLPPRPEDKNAQKPPTYLAIHEFDTETPDLAAVMKTAETEWSKRILGGVGRVEQPVFRVVEGFGKGGFFH
ncbi:Dimeric alpha+beta barrel [Glarea lozoyensis ATCC 20868]|uniref:Dimeric alpha+beta barrel n=1 Tax=Glarea lozoyensis (strain ATCC 20868 / MF5171) TaxID=1116229 RepID=S3D8E1_GLAL2|nr:Dimeric alpha+beta barrel [Glarea lozoyensis ATCC 20868]EPE33409.1 Dimeric alpha+beta barrel [Glarea lozoyensis ATCC 20868]